MQERDAKVNRINLSAQNILGRNLPGSPTFLLFELASRVKQDNMPTKVGKLLYSHG